MKNQIMKPDYAGEIGAALAVIRQGKTVMRSPAPEIFDLYCFCAVHDRPYTLRFVRQASGLLRFKETIKGQPATSPDNCRGGGIGWTLRLDYFETTAAPCAWCGDRSFHHCRSYCGALVCGGRMDGNRFHCRRSCGASWVGKPLCEVRGSASREHTPACTSLPRPSRRVTAPPRLMLPAAGKKGSY